jgi:hypothetical protein
MLSTAGSLDNQFFQGGYSAEYTGIITLEEYVPEPSTTLLGGFALLTLALLRRRGTSSRSP